MVEIKTRGPEAFRRWQTLGAERSHPGAVAQAAFYTLGQFGEMRPTPSSPRNGHRRPHLGLGENSRRPAGEVPCKTPAPGWVSLTARHVQNGPDPERPAGPGTSTADSWQCRSCPFLDICLPGALEVDEGEESDEKEVTDEEAREAVADLHRGPGVHQ